MSKLGQFAAAGAAVLCAVNGFGALPAPYQAVEYIESHGKEGFDAGFSPAKAGGTGVEIEFAMTGGGTSRGNVFSCQYCDYNNYMMLSQQGSVCFGQGFEVVPYVEGLRTLFECSTTGAWTVYTNGFFRKSGTGASLQNNQHPKNLRMFDCGKGSYAVYCRNYGTRFWTNDGPIRTFVPCYSNGVDGVRVGGMYDLVEGKFYTTDNGGAFTWGADRLLSDDLLVRGDPVNCGTPSIAYGVHPGYAVDAPVTISFPRVGMNAEETIQGTCTGYEVLTNGCVYASGTFDDTTGDTCSFSFNFPDCDHGAEVVLKWTAQCKVSATCDSAKGTVSKTFEWHTPGETFTVAVTEEKAGYGFFRWMGSDGKEYGRDKTLTIIVADGLTLTAEFGVVADLLPSGEDDTEAITAAINAVGAGGVVRLAAGTYKISSTVVVNNDIMVCGATGDRDDVVIDAQNKCRAFWLKDTPGTLKDLTVTHGYQGSYTGKGGGVYMEGGLVQNCRFTVCKTCQEGSGGAIYMTAGTVEDTQVDANVTYNGAFYGTVCLNGENAVFRNSQVVDNGPINTSGNGMNTLGVNLQKGLVENCLIANNKIGSQSSTASHGCPALSISGGTAKGCSIVGNGGSANTAAGYTFAAVNKSNGSIIDTLIFDNWDGAGHRADVRGTLTGFSNCCLPSLEGVSGENLIAAADALWFVENGVFGYYPGSPCIEPQIGIPGSYDPGEAMCAFTNPADIGGLEPYTASFMAQVDGTALPDPVRFRWTFTDPAADEPIVETVAEADYSKTLSVGKYDVKLEIVDGNGTAYASFEKKALVVVSTSDCYPADTSELLEVIAAQADGMVIHLAANTTYSVSETIVIRKNIQIVGADRDTTIVEGSGKVRIFKVVGETAPNAVIANLTIQKGCGCGEAGGGGEGMMVNYGGGAALLDQGGTIENCIIEKSVGSGNVGGHGVQIVGAGKIVDSIIRNITGGNDLAWGQALIAGNGALVDHCVISNIQATALRGSTAPVELYGSGTEMRNCLITGCKYGLRGDAAVGVYFRTAGAKLTSCTITGNEITSASGYAVRGSGTVKNCVIVDNLVNTAVVAAETGIGGGASATYSLIRPSVSGTGNVTSDTVFKMGTFDLAYGSPAIGSGDVESWMMQDGAKDLKGVDRLRDGKVDMGAFSYVPPAIACSIACADEKKVLDAVDVTITSSVEGNTEGVVYSWKVNGVEAGTDATFNFETSLAGTHSVVLDVVNASGDTASSEPIVFTVVPSTIYVDSTSTEPVAPYGDPAHAAANLQEAVDAALAGCTIVVAPGTYTLAKTLYVTRRLVIRSSGNRDNTILHVGGSFPGVSLDAAGSEFAGFTVEHGYMSKEQYANGGSRGGGNLYAGEGTLVHDCRFSDASCYGHDPVMGGTSLGVYNATVRDCEIVNNTRTNRGTGWQMYRGAVQVSGANSVVERCLFEGNVHVNAHRGSEWRCVAGLYLVDGHVRNCLFRNNRLEDSGTGSSNVRSAAAFVAGGTLENCTFVSNTIVRAGSDTPPAGVYANGGTVRNCIIWDNVNSGDGVANWGGTEAKFAYCCTLPALADEHSISTDPMFKNPAACDGVLRTVSPCARKGLFAASWMTEALDFYGKPMAYGVRKNHVGIGCYAVPVASGLSIFIR